jgi:hypothetical protein
MAFHGLNIKREIMNSQALCCIVAALLLFSSCTVSRIYPRTYYEQHKETLHETESLYHDVTQNKLIAIGFNDLGYNDISLELKTDTVRYIYDFTYGEKRMNDTLHKFGYDSALVHKIIDNMRNIKSTWINTMEYYEGGKKEYLLFISAPVKQFSLLPFLQKRKYYLYNFYKQPQYYDEQGRMLDKKKLKQLRKISGEIFWRITDKVSYTVSVKFR